MAWSKQLAAVAQSLAVLALTVLSLFTEAVKVLVVKLDEAIDELKGKD